MRAPLIALLFASAATSAFAGVPIPPSTAISSSVAAPPAKAAAASPHRAAPKHHKPTAAALAMHRASGSDAGARVAEATAAARVQPSGAGYLGAIQVYPFSEGALYQVYTAPGEVTDIALEPGEALAGSGPVAAGDTVRWIIGDTQSGAGETRRVHVLVKPTRGDLATNLVINTDRRTYHLELRATARTYMASVSFAFPKDALIAIAGSPDAAKPRVAPPEEARGGGHPATHATEGPDIDALAFRYRITGDKPPWRPLSAFDDGRQVYIQFPPGISQGEMPPLWVLGPNGAELVNYRVQGAHMVVDRLFAVAELRLGGKHSVKVRIVRTDKAAS